MGVVVLLVLGGREGERRALQRRRGCAGYVGRAVPGVGERGIGRGRRRRAVVVIVPCAAHGEGWAAGSEERACRWCCLLPRFPSQPTSRYAA